eukprot:8900081-Karenia_brevis.AAC.1
MAKSISRERGLCQGRVESMLQFVLSVAGHVYDVIENWKQKGWGFQVGHAWLGMLSYADDFIILARSSLQLKQMIDQLEASLSQIGLNFSTKYGKS